MPFYLRGDLTLTVEHKCTGHTQGEGINWQEQSCSLLEGSMGARQGCVCGGGGVQGFPAKGIACAKAQTSERVTRNCQSIEFKMSPWGDELGEVWQGHMKGFSGHVCVGTLLLKARVSEPGTLRRLTAGAVWGMGLGQGQGQGAWKLTTMQELMVSEAQVGDVGESGIRSGDLNLGD